MREIKFRAWDTVHNEWFGADWWGFGVDGSIVVSSEDQERWWYLEKDRLIIMQYTGLKDKNGVEIYEGDVVKGRNGDVYPVVFENGGFRTNGVIPHPKYFSDDEVVGNSYENPELLK